MTSADLAHLWQPYVTEVIERFGVDRCMFEGNFPTDSVPCTYPVLRVQADDSGLFGG